MEKKTPEEITRERLYAIKEKINKGKENPRVRRVALIGGGALVLLVAFVVLTFSVKIKNINVTGDVSLYNETRVAAASEIDIGKSFMSKSSFAIKKSIRKNIPLADDIRVRKNIFTGDVNIDITFEPFDYYIEHKSVYYALDENLVVVDVRKNENDFASLGARLIEIPKTCRPVFGEPLVFYDTVANPDGERETPLTEDEIVDISEYQYIYDILLILKESDEYSHLTAIDLQEKYDIVAIYDGKFKVNFGSMSSFELKLDVLGRILIDTSWQHYECGEINLTDPTAATAKSVQSIYDDDKEGIEG